MGMGKAPKCVSAHIRSVSFPWTWSASIARVAIGPEDTAVTACWRGLVPTSPCPICSSPFVVDQSASEGRAVTCQWSTLQGRGPDPGGRRLSEVDHA